MIFTIHKGIQFCTPRLPIPLLFRRKFHFKVKFDKSALYELGNDNQADINKLSGFTEGLTKSPEDDSCRFGWNCIAEKIYLYGYVDHNGVHTAEKIMSVPLDKWIDCSIKILDSIYGFAISWWSGDNWLGFKSEYSCVIDRNHTGRANGWLLYPYFGGDEKARNDIKINVKF